MGVTGVGKSTDRLQARPGRFMPPTPMDNQLAAMERPGADEADVVTVMARRPIHDIDDEIAHGLAGRADPGAR